MDDLIASSRNKIVGTKQTIKALENGEVQKVFIAKDAEKKIIRPIITLCETNNIELQYVESMQQLGKLCGIKVKAAAAAIKE